MRLLILISLILGKSLSSYASSNAEAPMVRLPDGYYRPLYLEPPPPKAKIKPQKRFKRGEKIRVSSFYLDRTAVTRSDFLDFVRQEPQWSRSQIKRIFAEKSYLQDWASDFDPGREQNPQSPVRYVSWFAARAYCESRSKRLPTLAEWEYAGTSYSKLKNINRSILDWYSKPMPATVPPVNSGFKNDFGISDLHGLVWEWIEDFNSSLVTGESRADSSLDQSAFCGSGGLNANDFEDYAAFMRFGFRSSLRGSFALANLGFRCARRPLKGE